jgi:hypothetical protein
MQLSNLFVLLPLATAVSGLALPKGTPPGIYQISVVNGTESAPVKIGDLYTGPGPVVARSLDKRDTNGPTGRTLSNHADYNTCTNTWRNYIQGGGMVGPRSKVIVTNGVAELVGCNYHSESNPVTISSTLVPRLTRRSLCRYLLRATGRDRRPVQRRHGYRVRVLEDGLGVVQRVRLHVLA